MSVVHCNIFDPTKSLFKEHKNSKARCTVVRCSQECCEVRDAGSCMLLALLFGTKCPYGDLSRFNGYTRRARKFSQWIKEHRERYVGVPFLKTPRTKMAFVGDYVYLPYSHMTMCEAVPFLAPGGAFRNGNCMLPLGHWTIDNVIRLIDFRPHALMGGEILNYQKEIVPQFLLHLRERDSKMWGKLVVNRPKLDVKPDHVGRKALLKTLVYPIEWKTKNLKYQVTWRWDGTYLITTSPNAYSKTWGAIALSEMELRAKPDDDAEIEIKDNAWVTDDTVFTT